MISLVSLAVEARPLSPEQLHLIEDYTNSSDAWLAFLSPTAVSIFEEICQGQGIDLSASPVRLAAQGPGTREVARKVFQRDVDLESTVSTAEVFAEQLSSRLEGRGHVLVPQAAEGRDVLGPFVRAQGNTVESISTYELKRVRPAQSDIDAVIACDAASACVVFMSPSAVRATVEAFPDLERLRSLRAISIGPSTSKAMRECGLKVYAEATDHSEEGVMRCVSGAFTL